MPSRTGQSGTPSSARGESATQPRQTQIRQTQTRQTQTRQVAGATDLQNAPNNARTRLVGNRDGALAAVVVGTVRGGRMLRETLTRWITALTTVVTPVGWAVAAGVLVGFVLGYSLGWVELVTVAWSGAVVIVLAALFLVGRTVHRADLRMPVTRVVAGERAIGELTVTNPTSRWRAGTRIEIPVGEGRAEFHVPALAAASEYSDVFSVPALRRGVITVGPARSVRADPVGLVRRERAWGESFSVFVHPQTISIPSMSTGFVRDLEGNPTRDLTASDMSFHALREYVPGDERRNIHWKSTAKTGQFMVRQFEQTRRSHLVVALSLAASDYASDDEFEMAVSVAGSLGVRAIRDARTVTVAVSESTPEFARRRVLALRPLAAVTPTRLLDDLSGVETAATALGIADLARVASDSTGGVSLAFIICGSPPSVTTLRHAASFFPVGVEVVAVVCDPEIVPSLRRSGELTVLTIGFLDDLANALMRSAR